MTTARKSSSTFSPVLTAEDIQTTAFPRNYPGIIALITGGGDSLDGLDTTNIDPGTVVIIPNLVIPTQTASGLSITPKSWVLRVSTPRPTASVSVIHSLTNPTSYWEPS